MLVFYHETLNYNAVMCWCPIETSKMGFLNSQEENFLSKTLSMHIIKQNCTNKMFSILS